MKYIIANWKMNLPEERGLYYKALRSLHRDDRKIIISPPATHILQMKNLGESLKKDINDVELPLACQDVSIISKNEGSYTGDLSAGFLRNNLEIQYGIIGHSERRMEHRESDEIVSAKCTNLLKAGITPIFCVGENAQTRRDGTWQKFILSQLSFLANSFNYATEEREIIIAYEPIWAIGADKPASIEEITDATIFIKEQISKLAKNAKIVYGGAVNGENISEIAKISELSGVLVGRASLNLPEFIKIIKEYA